ncbi:MAG: phage virion morphogenesis protein [Candidatus Symbiothrix sp.]|jgi:phage gpG-like protein|nr:phage virion morphogenesis protein [Candidatus Symbiothrix sp.]
MTVEEFAAQCARWSAALEEAVDSRIPHEMGVKAIELYRENFDRQGYFGERWDPRKVAKNAPHATKILQQSKALVNSMRVVSEGGGEVVIESDLPYSRIHNEGGVIRQTVTDKQRRWMGANLKASKKTGSVLEITIPKRQFMGDHPTLREELAKEVKEVLEEIFDYKN